MTARYIVGDVFDTLAKLEADGTQVDLVMTSPPFLALRSYLPPDHPDKARELGSEATPAEFLDTMLDVVDACARVLAPHGSICFEFGDTYAGSGGAGGDYGESGLRDGQPRYKQSDARKEARVVLADGRSIQSAGIGNGLPRKGNGWPLDKSLCLIPELFAASLAYGRNLLNPEHTVDPWRIRNLVAWVRPNPPVGALGDKVRPATSYLTWATKAKDRWFDLDAVRTAAQDQTPRNTNGPKNLDRKDETPSGYDRRVNSNPAGAPPLDWWKISPGGYTGSHYAVYPAELCRVPIEASCPRRVCVTCGMPSRREVEASERYAERKRTHAWQSGGLEKGAAKPAASVGWDDGTPVVAEHTTTGWSTCGCPGTDGIRLDGYHTGLGWRPGVVLDPFAGSGTTLLAATGLSRAAIGIDIDERNADLARERLGMFLEVQ